MKKFFLLTGILLLLAACAENKSNDTSSSSYQVTGKVIYVADNFKSANVCVDANNNGLADDAYCTETAGDGSYSFISNDSINSYPLVASITTVNTAVNARLNTGGILMYAPKGKTDVISIETTLIKSIMEQNSTKTYENANAEVTALMEKADNKTLLTVYTNALNSADIQNWESSIRGIVGAVTNKLLESTEITADTIITVTQEEVDNINNIIKEEDNKEQQQPENPNTEPATPLEKVTEILAGAEIKNSAENPVNLNEYIDRTVIHYNQSSEITNFIGIKYDTFGEFSDIPMFTNVSSLLKDVNYKEGNWPSDSSLHFEVFPDSSTDQNGYFFSNHFYKYRHESGNFIADNICSANGKVNGVFYKPIVSDTEMAAMESDLMQCAKNSGIDIDENGQISQNDIDKMLVCFVDTWFQHKNNYKLEKWYWTIDTTQLNECKQSLTPLEKVTEMLAGAEIKNSAENPVNLNEYLDPANNEIDKDGALLKLGIKSDAFGEYSSNMLMTSNQLLRIINYKEENWPSDSSLEFEVLVTGNVTNGGYYLTNYPSNISMDNVSVEPHSDNVCGVNGKMNGIYYKSVFDISLYDIMEAEYMLCYRQNGGINDPASGSLDGNDMKILIDCFAEAAYNNKDNIKIEKWYWTIDTTLLEECK